MLHRLYSNKIVVDGLASLLLKCCRFSVWNVAIIDCAAYTEAGF